MEHSCHTCRYGVLLPPYNAYTDKPAKQQYLCVGGGASYQAMFEVKNCSGYKPMTAKQARLRQDLTKLNRR